MIPLRSLLKRVLLYALIWASSTTTRKTRINWNVLESLARSGRPAVLCAWHNTILYFLHVLAPLNLTTMISRSRDGDDIAWVAARCGMAAVRGSPAEGGAMALRELLRVVGQGRNIVITPDGPRGPRYAVKPGIVALARHKRLPIVPVAYSAPRRWEFGSWDRMKLPVPFSRTVIWVGDPIEVAALDEAEGLRQVEAAMRRLTQQAEAFTGADARYPDPALHDPAPQA